MMNVEDLLYESRPLPTNYIIDVNHDCGFKCSMCVKRTMQEGFGQRPMSDFVQLVEKLPWANSIWLGALGDPFSYRDLWPLLQYLNYRKIHAPLTTNGIALTAENVMLLPPGCQVHVSLDGGTEESYRMFRHESLKPIMDNVAAMRRSRPDITTTINMLLFKDNLESLPAMIDFAYWNSLNLTCNYPLYFNKQFEQEHSAHRHPDLLKHVLNAVYYARDRKVSLAITNPLGGQMPCMKTAIQAMVAYDGTIYPCDYVYQDIEHHRSWPSHHLDYVVDVPQWQYAMGNLYHEDYNTVWQSAKFKRLRRKITELSIKPLTGELTDHLDVDLNEEFKHCEVCFYRWQKCF